MAISPLEMRIEFSMGDFERIFYALSFYYINFLLFFHFLKEITELNIYLTFSIIRALLVFFKLISKENLIFLQQIPVKIKFSLYIFIHTFFVRCIFFVFIFKNTIENQKSHFSATL